MGPKKDRVVSRASFRISAARLAAIQALYELSLSNRNPKEVLETFAAKRWRSITLIQTQNPSLGERLDYQTQTSITSQRLSWKFQIILADMKV